MAAKHCLPRGVEGRTPGIHILLPKHRCHSYTQQDAAPAAVDRKNSTSNSPETLRIASTLDENFCCKSMPLTFPSKASSMKAVAAAKAKNASAKNRKDLPVLAADDAADWIDRAVKDPLVEIDPVTVAQQMLTKSVPARRIQVESVPARGLKIVATSQQPIWYRFDSFSAARGFGSVLIALGASIVLATLAAAMPLIIKAQRKPVVSVDYASSDEETKLDLQSIVALSGSDVEQEEQAQEQEESELIIQPGLAKSAGEIVVIPELLVAAAAAATALRDDFQQVVAEFNSRHEETDELLQYHLQLYNLANAQHDVGANALQMKDLNQAESSSQTTILVNQEEDHAQLEDSDRIAVEAAKLVIEIGGDSGNGYNSFNNPEDEKQESHRAAVTVSELPPPTLASEHHYHGSIPRMIYTNRFQDQEFGSPSFDIDILRSHGLESQGSSTGSPLSTSSRQGVQSKNNIESTGEVELYQGRLEAAVQNTGMRRREEMSNLVPAFAVGAGAMSIISGVDGALEMVGFAATASFICYDLLWAEAREDLLKDIDKITNHRKLLEFLESKNVILG